MQVVAGISLSIYDMMVISGRGRWHNQVGANLLIKKYFYGKN